MPNKNYYSDIHTLMMLNNAPLWTSSDTCSTFPFSTAAIILSFRTTVCPWFIFSLSMSFPGIYLSIYRGTDISECPVVVLYNIVCDTKGQGHDVFSSSTLGVPPLYGLQFFISALSDLLKILPFIFAWSRFNGLLFFHRQIFFYNLSTMASSEVRYFLRSILTEYMLIKAGMYYINKLL